VEYTNVKNIIAICLLLLTTQTLADQATAAKSGCAGCHQMSIKTVGPSIKDIAQKYKGGNVDQLVATVKAGRSGDQLTWGKIPMPPNPAPEADVRKVIEWMLSQ
jgi:cytochrome c551/c552